MAGVKQRRKTFRVSSNSSGEKPEGAALSVFGLMVVLAPLAFGAVDRLVQLGLLGLLAIGLWLRPVQWPALSRRRRWLALGFAALVVLSQFAPARLFGGTEWRRVLTSAYELPLPWTHHPEPGRAVDALLAAGVALCWFCWVRTVAGWRPNRAALAWILFSAAAVVAFVSFCTRVSVDPKAIYGLRITPGWKGFGPFPNRNHTASFLAMGALLGAGCTSWAASRQRVGLALAGVGLFGLTLAALLATQSRGGLIGFGAGGVVLMLLVLARFRTQRTLAILGGIAVGVCAMGLAIGAPLLARFHDADTQGSNQGRRDIWHDAARLWHDAPLLGHGLASFAGVFPIYEEQVQSDNEIVLHPESSWLLWLAELGLVPVAAGVLALLVFAARKIPLIFERQNGFFLMASGLAALVALLTHSVVDVPAHRWATAGFGLAALALAAPQFRRRIVAAGDETVSVPVTGGDRRLALVPLAIAGFWLLPFLTDGPAWSPLSLARLLARASAPGAPPVPAAQLEQALADFPLDAELHQLAGLQQLREGLPGWRNHFRIASRLSPGRWALSIRQAKACADVAPGYALNFWQEAVDRGGFRAPEILGQALDATRGLPNAPGVWSAYVTNHPELALVLAASLPPGEGKPFFDLWWARRVVPPRTVLSESEIENFYARTGSWATADQIRFWMDRMKDRAPRDYPRWTRLLHGLGADLEAWTVISQWRPDPAWPGLPDSPPAQLERRWQMSPENMINAQALATTYYVQHNPEGERKVLHAALERPGTPEWFVRKAAWLEASEGHLEEAVALLLKEDQPK